MNWLFYRRIRGPIFLLTFGVTAALAQWDILSFGRSWPLYLIVYGVLRLVEGAAYATMPAYGVYPAPSYGAPIPGQPSYGAQAPNYPPKYAPNYAPNHGPASPATGLATIPAAPIQPARHSQEES